MWDLLVSNPYEAFTISLFLFATALLPLTDMTEYEVEINSSTLDTNSWKNKPKIMYMNRPPKGMITLYYERQDRWEKMINNQLNTINMHSLHEDVIVLHNQFNSIFFFKFIFVSFLFLCMYPYSDYYLKKKFQKYDQSSTNYKQNVISIKQYNKQIKADLLWFEEARKKVSTRALGLKKLCYNLRWEQSLAYNRSLEERNVNRMKFRNAVIENTRDYTFSNTTTNIIHHFNPIFNHLDDGTFSPKNFFKLGDIFEYRGYHRDKIIFNSIIPVERKFRTTAPIMCYYDLVYSKSPSGLKIKSIENIIEFSKEHKFQSWLLLHIRNRMISEQIRCLNMREDYLFNYLDNDMTQIVNNDANRLSNHVWNILLKQYRTELRSIENLIETNRSLLNYEYAYSEIKSEWLIDYHDLEMYWLNRNLSNLKLIQHHEHELEKDIINFLKI